MLLETREKTNLMQFSVWLKQDFAAINALVT